MKNIVYFLGIVLVSITSSLTTIKLIGNKENTEATKESNFVSGSFASYTSNQATRSMLDFTEPAEIAMPAVVHIKSIQTVRTQSRSSPNPFREFFGDDLFEDYFAPNQQQGNKPRIKVGSGSGVLIKSNGYIVTNNHVIANADELEVTLYDNRTLNAKVIGTDPSTDLALLKIEGDNFPNIQFANSDNVRIGEWVLAVGNPFNLNSTVTAGIVSAKARNINILRDKYAIESFIQTDAAINPGNSGGALINLNGELVGINTAIASPTGSYSGYGFAVPSNIVSKVINDLESYGVVQRGFLGVMIRDVDSELAKEKNLKLSEGVYIESMSEKSAAENAGIQSGDVIMEVNSSTITSSPELQEAIGRHKPGDTVSIKVNRSGEEKIFEVVLTNKDGDIQSISKNDIAVLDILGIEIQNIEFARLKDLNLDNGVRVTKIGPGKISKHTDMKEGFIITKIDNVKVKSTEHFKELLSKKTGGILLEGRYEQYPGDFYFAFGL